MREHWHELHFFTENAFPDEPLVNWHVKFKPQNFRLIHGWRLYKDLL